MEIGPEQHKLDWIARRTDRQTGKLPEQGRVSVWSPGQAASLPPGHTRARLSRPPKHPSALGESVELAKMRPVPQVAEQEVQPLHAVHALHGCTAHVSPTQGIRMEAPS